MGEAKTIATKPLQSFFIYVSSQVVFRENSNNLVVVGYVLTYPGNKYDNNCFFGSLPGILPTDITPISQAGSIRILKKALLYYYRPNFVYYCVCAFERTFDRTSSSS